MEKVKTGRENREEKKDSKLEEQVLKTLAEATDSDGKLKLLLKKFVEVEKENKRLQTTIKQNEKTLEAILKEKEHLQKDYNKSVLMRNKLEDVCREQQKLIKSVKNESMLKIREEEERRKESQSKFQSSINDINQTLFKNNSENIKLREDNIAMEKRLRYLAEQYQNQEKHLDKINEQVSIEQQLHEAKLAKFQMESAIEKEILLREKETALAELLNCKKAIKDLTEREQALKEQLNIYTSKYDEFQTSLQKSNHIFSNYKVEIDKMAKNTSKLERESLEWKSKWQKCNIALIEMATERKEKDDYVAKCTRQVQQLQKLLRALQGERTLLHKLLKENNIEQPSVPILPPEPETMPVPPPPEPQKDKMELMVKNCAELKKTLASLQGQMNEITNKQNTNSGPSQASTPAEEVQKKKKNKKQNNKSKRSPLNKTPSNEETPEQQVTPTAENQTSVATEENGNENSTAPEESKAAEALTEPEATAIKEPLPVTTNGFNKEDEPKSQVSEPENTVPTEPKSEEQSAIVDEQQIPKSDSAPTPITEELKVEN